MSLLPAVLALGLHAMLMLGGAPLLTGLLRCWSARLQGRDGPPVMQPYLDLQRLVRKQPIVADTASAVFRLVPGGVLAPTVLVSLLLPSFTLGMASAPLADLLLIGGLLLLAKAVLALGGWDAGTAAGGMGASRRMALITQPALLLATFVLAVVTGTTNLDLLAAWLLDMQRGPSMALALAALALVTVMLIETEHLGPGQAAAPMVTGQALSMGRDAAVLEYSGWHLAVLDYAASLHRLSWMTLVGVLVLPAGLAPADGGILAWGIGLVAWVVKSGVMLLGLAALDAFAPRLRQPSLRAGLGVATLLAILSAILLLAEQRSA